MPARLKITRTWVVNITRVIVSCGFIFNYEAKICEFLILGRLQWFKFCDSFVVSSSVMVLEINVNIILVMNYYFSLILDCHHFNNQSTTEQETKKHRVSCGDLW